MPKIQVNKIDLFYDIQGTGEPLLLIAGFNSDSSSWSAMMPHVSTTASDWTIEELGKVLHPIPTALSKWQRMPHTARLSRHSPGACSRSFHGGQIAQELAYYTRKTSEA